MFSWQLRERTPFPLATVPSSPYLSQESVPGTPTFSCSCFTISLYNVLTISLIYNTCLGTEKSLSTAVLYLLVYSLSNGLYNALIFSSGTQNIEMKSHRQVKFLFICQMTLSVIAHTI